MSNVPGRSAVLEQANAINLASAAPSKMRSLAEFGESLRIRAAPPFFDQPLARPWLPWRTLVSSAADLLVAPASPPPRIGFQQNADLQQLLCWMFSRYG